ncbi:MAG: hypothetical protein K0S76_1473 [Herbinix sp.]|jgi:hypothetical protein|nr:hypothetical protein [Herbinix sp.]
MEQYNCALNECNQVIEELCLDIDSTEVLCSQILENVIENINNGLMPFKK